MITIHVLFSEVGSMTEDERWQVMHLGKPDPKRQYVRVYQCERGGEETDEAYCNEMWTHCQNIDRHWRSPPCRSMMIGDVVIVDGRAYVPQFVGWERFNELDATPCRHCGELYTHTESCPDRFEVSDA